MSISPELLKELSEIEMPGDSFRKVVALIAVLQSKGEEKKKKDRERKRISKEKSAPIPAKTDGNSVGNSAEIPLENPPSLPPKKYNQTPNPTPTELRSDKIRDDHPAASQKVEPKKPPRPDVRSILLSVLSVEVADGVIEHRRKLRKPLTEMAAQGLAKAFAATGQPEAAARMMVERGWQGFRLDWFESDRKTLFGGRSPPRDGCGELLDEIAQERARRNGQSPDDGVQQPPKPSKFAREFDVAETLELS